MHCLQNLGYRKADLVLSSIPNLRLHIKEEINILKLLKEAKKIEGVAEASINTLTGAIRRQQSAQEKLWLPKTALKHHPDGGYSVFSVTNNVAKRHIVNVIAEQAERIAVTNAPSNHAFVMSGVEALSDGLKVTVSSVKGSAQ